MKPFHTVAIPHRDILEDKLTLEVFAADLWDTYLGRAPPEYSDSDTFFRKTYPTQGLRYLLDIIESRLIKGLSGDPVIQLQTPFGGGKTHALIAMYHKAKEWNSNIIVISGTALSGQDTIWGLMEKQLTGNIRLLSGNVSPGREGLREVLEKHQPVLILIDEILEYVVKAAGVPVGESTLAAQTLAFTQELTELAGTLDKTCVVITLPSSMLEHYDQNAERLYQKLQKISGRVERIYSPVEPHEITKVIRKRLFSNVDEKKSLESILEFLDYAEKEEGVLPIGKEPNEYGDIFEDSYPFLPEVIETLYQRWGSIPTFQRTRGVLRLLSLVVGALSESSLSYITLSDFSLEKDAIRRELINHIGPEFDSVISADITNPDSGSKRVDKLIGKSFQGIRLGTRTATAVFMYSFSGGQEKGACIREVKRSATTLENPSSVVVEALDQLKDRLFFLQNQNDKFFFSNQPNLNRILLTKIENIRQNELVEAEKELILGNVKGRNSNLKTFLLPEKPKDVPDNEDLKFVVLSQFSDTVMRNFIETKGDSPRVYVNTVVFLCPLESERSSFLESLKKVIALRELVRDRTLYLSDEQRNELQQDLRMEEDRVRDLLLRLYRLIYLPAKGNSIIKELDLGIPDVTIRRSIIDEAYEGLLAEGEILQKISPLVIKERYLKEIEFIKLEQIYDSMMKTPGEVRYLNRDVIEKSIIDGVKQGLFGIGEIKHDTQIENEQVFCRYFKEDMLAVDPNCVIVADRVCQAQRRVPGSETIVQPSIIEGSNIYGKDSTNPLAYTDDSGNIHETVNLSFDVPRGKISQIMGIMNFLQQKFEVIHLEIKADKGAITDSDYIHKIKESLNQLGIRWD